jgi:hypothetical protein
MLCEYQPRTLKLNTSPDFREPLKRSVRVEGRVERVDPHQSDEYFASRPFGSQVPILWNFLAERDI